MKYQAVILGLLSLTSACVDRWTPPEDSTAEVIDSMLKCDEDPSVCAIAHFTETMGFEPRVECQEAARATMLDFVDSNTLHRKCGQDRVACVTAYSLTGSVATLETSELGLTPAVSVHEITHVLLRCQKSDFDSDHRLPVWNLLRTDI
jgi:hypothetical protein